MSKETQTEISEYFIPQEEIQSKNRTYLKWNRGLESVEVQLPGTKIAKTGVYETRPWINASFIYYSKLKNGRVVYKQTTCSYVYEKVRLELLLNELNR